MDQCNAHFIFIPIFKIIDTNYGRNFMKKLLNHRPYQEKYYCQCKSLLNDILGLKFRLLIAYTEMEIKGHDLVQKILKPGFIEHCA